MSVVVTLRLPEPLWQRLSDEAQLRGRALAEHIRESLSQQIDIVAELAALRAMLARRGESGNEADIAATLEALRDAAEDSDGMLPGDRAIALETLLLLREIAGPARTKPIQGSVEWEGLPVWRGSRI